MDPASSLSDRRPRVRQPRVRQVAKTELALKGKPCAATINSCSQREFSHPSVWVEFVFCRIKNGSVFIFKQERLAREAHITADQRHHLPRQVLKGLALV